MTEAAQLALIAAIPGYISGLTALIMALVAYRQLERSKQREAATLDVTQKVEKVIENTDKIKTATDGSLTEVKDQLKAVTDQNKTISEQNLASQATIKALSDAMATRRTEAKRETGDLIAEVENGNTKSYTNLLKEMAEMKNIMAEFAKTGMPVVAPAGEPLPVVAVKAGEAKK